MTVSKKKTAIEKIICLKIDGTLHSNLEMTSLGPDAVHIGKCLVGSLSNWWLIVDNNRISLVMLRILRNNINSEVGKQIQKCISLDVVQSKDRQSTEAVAEVCCPKLLEILSRQVHKIVCTIVPGQFRKCEDNKLNVLVEPVDIRNSCDTSVLFWCLIELVDLLV